MILTGSQTPHRSSPAIGRLFRPLLVAFALALFVNAFSDAHAAPSFEQQYEKAKQDMEFLKSDSKRGGWRERGKKLAQSFFDLHEKYPRWRNRPAALFRSALAMEELANQFSVLGYSTTGYQRIKAVEQEAPRIPEGYTELESITSSGTQYINTGVNPTSNTRVELRMSTSQSGSKTVFGSDVGWTANGFALGVNFAHYGTKNGSFTGLNDGGRIQWISTATRFLWMGPRY